MSAARLNTTLPWANAEPRPPARVRGHQQAVPDELAHRGQRRGHERVRRPVVRDGEQLHELAERQRPVAARQQVRGRAVHLVPPPRAVLPRHRRAHRRPAFGARLRPALQQHRRGERQPGGQQRRVVGVAPQPVYAIQPSLDLQSERIVERLI